MFNIKNKPLETYSNLSVSIHVKIVNVMTLTKGSTFFETVDFIIYNYAFSNKAVFQTLYKFRCLSHCADFRHKRTFQNYLPLYETKCDSCWGGG